jgi:hypothetical protein
MVVTCHHGTSVQRHCVYSSSMVSYPPCVTNTDQWLNTQSTTEQLGSRQRLVQGCHMRSYEYGMDPGDTVLP